MNPEPRWMRAADAARALNVNIQVIYNRRHKGKTPSLFNRVGDTLFVDVQGFESAELEESALREYARRENVFNIDADARWNI